MQNTYSQIPKFIQAHQQAPWRIQLMTIGMFTLVLVIMAIVAGVYLSFTARTANLGREIQEMRSTNMELQRLIVHLETSNALQASVSNMEQRARDLGYEPATADQIVYIKVPGYVRERQVQLAPPADFVVSSQADLPPEFTQTLFDWLFLTIQDLEMGGQP